MRKRWYWDNDKQKLIPAEEYKPKYKKCGMQIITDIDQQGKSYESPVHPGKWITSRREMKEDLIRSGCRQVEPGENPRYKT